MNLNRLQHINYLSLADLGSLATDLRYELEDMNMEHRSDLAIWYMRNKAYAPFNAIALAIEYSKPSNVVRAYNELLDGAGQPMSLDSDYSYVFDKFETLVVNHYGMCSNVYLDRQDADVADCLLWHASKACGMVDSRNNGPTYAIAPKEQPPVSCALEVIKLAHEGRTSEIYSNFHITSTL